ncbi:MAG: DUF6470 family protein [Peptococcaceae bacterium]
MLQIRTTPALLGINTIWGRQRIEQPRGELHIEQPRAELKIDRELPKVLIDQYRCFAEAGLKRPLDLMKEIRQRNYNKFLRNIAEMNQEGDMLAQIEKGGNPIAVLGAKRAFPARDFNIGFIPQSRPEFEVTGHLEIEWQLNKPQISYEVRKPVIDYLPGRVEIFLRQWPDIDFNYINEQG